MIFLIEYNKPKGCIVNMQTFDESDRRKAQDALLALELDLHRKRIDDHEAVLLEADSEEALRKTHRRYFENVEEIVKSLSGKTD